MSFTLKMQFVGLCHFIENGKTAADQRRLCVLLPRVPRSASDPCVHEARLFFAGEDLVSLTRLSGLQGERLARKRVFFRYRYSAGQQPAARSLSGQYGETPKLEEVIGDGSAAWYCDVVASTPDLVVDSQIMVGRGTIAPGAESSEWLVPVNLGRATVQRSVPAFIEIDEPGLERVEVVIEDLDPTPGLGPGGVPALAAPRTLVFETGEPEIHLTFTADCQLGTVRRGSEVRAASFVPDTDFAEHYKFLQFERKDEVSTSWRALRTAALSPVPTSVEWQKMDWPIPIWVRPQGVEMVLPSPNLGLLLKRLQENAPNGGVSLRIGAAFMSIEILEGDWEPSLNLPDMLVLGPPIDVGGGEHIVLKDSWYWRGELEFNSRCALRIPDLLAGTEGTRVFYGDCMDCVGYPMNLSHLETYMA